MPRTFTIPLLAALTCFGGAVQAADLGYPPPGPGGARPSYDELWGEPEIFHQGRSRPARRVMGGPDYVGSNYGLAKPSYYGIGPRPDWGRSTYD